MRIHTDFTGGNIAVKERIGDTFFLENELRDTQSDWFYWAFCVEGAQGKTLTFRMQRHRLGYFGPAVSHDLVNWHWLEQVDGDSFSYTFGEKEDQVYFAHSMLYHPSRFAEFAKKQGLEIQTLCKGYKGSFVPCVEFGDGINTIILTARHHACESTGNFVLEGVLECLLADPIPGYRVFCVPFVDYEGMIRGDQGKARDPHDHNRDYDHNIPSIYPECAAIREYAKKRGCTFAFDFHSPWHKSGKNDTAFIVRNREDRTDLYDRFGALLEENTTEDAFRYEMRNDQLPETEWNHFGSQFACYMSLIPGNQLTFTLETAYFGTPENRVTEQGLLALGRCFANALRAYIGDDTQ